MITALLALAAAAVVLLGVTWIAYPGLLMLLGRGAARAPIGVDASPVATGDGATVVIATREPPDVLQTRVANLRASDFPASRLTILVAVDATSPHALAEYRAALGDSAEVVQGDPPGGKASALNAGVRRATTPILIFADSRQSFSENAVRDLVAQLDDARLGAVSGLVVQERSGDGLMDRYWQFEVAMRTGQSRRHSIICVSGGIYAMRRALWEPIPAGTICDDLFVTMQVVQQGYRVALCTAARAVDDRRFTRQQHFDRKVRTMTGLLQLCAVRPSILVPWRNGIWIDFLFHKILRLATPLLVAVIAFSLLGAALVAAPSATALLVGAAAVAVGVASAIRPATVRQLADRVRWLLRVQTVPLIAMSNAARGRWQVWQHSTIAAKETPRPTPSRS